MAQAQANGISIEYEVFGEGNDESILLIMGLGAQLTRWPVEFCEKLVARGYRVIRFDNRDIGLSTRFDSAAVPDLREVVAAIRRGEDPQVPYLLDDLAADAVGLLDALGIARAHIVGASMGGMIAQLVAADYPERALSLTSIMSTTGHLSLKPATREALAALGAPAPHPSDIETFVAEGIARARVIGSPGYPFDEAEMRAQLIADAERCFYPEGFARQIAAINASGHRREKCRKIKCPTVVVHGADDPLIPLPGGEDTAAHIEGAELLVIPGMGHDLPPGLYDTIVAAIDEVAERALKRRA